MRTLFIIPLVLMSLVSSPSWGLTMDNLISRDGLFYKKFTDIPFTGEVEGMWSGSIKNGKYEGTWVSYHSNGQLKGKLNVKLSKSLYLRSRIFWTLVLVKRFRIV